MRRHIDSLPFADEGNWRNDYPDEDEGLSDSSQERRFYEDYGFDSGELHCSWFIKQGISDTTLFLVFEV